MPPILSTTNALATIGAQALPFDATEQDELLASMEAELDERTPVLQIFEDYYEGRHKLAFATARFREQFGQMLAAVSDNWCPLVIRATIERMHVQGFRVGPDQAADDDAWEIWQRNDMDESADLAFVEASKHGESYLLVWFDDLQDGLARITAEHPKQMIVRRVPGDRTRLRAAFKRWWDPEQEIWNATLWTPESVHRRYRTKESGWWEPRGERPDEENPLGLVPVVPLVNDPHMLPCYPPSALLAAPHRVPMAPIGLGRSDLADVISTIDAVNKLICDMLVASELASFRQRWATGLEVPRDPQTGEPIEPFRSAVNRLWVAEDPETKFGEFGATDLGNYIRAIESRIQSLASRTRTPPHYLLGGMGSFPSGESLRAAETGLVAKIRDKQRNFGGALERAVRLAFQIEGDEQRAIQWEAEVDWAEPESRVESQYVDSLVKKLSIGVPVRQLWEDYGYSPQQIARFGEMLQEQAQMSGLSTQAAQGLPPNPLEQAPAETQAPSGPGA